MKSQYIALLIIGGIIIALLLILISRTFLVIEKSEFVFMDEEERFWKMFKVIECESQFNNNAIGKDGERGLAQFLSSTFYNFAKKYNLNLDINNERDQIKLMMLMFKNGYANLWTCYNKLEKI